MEQLGVVHSSVNARRPPPTVIRHLSPQSLNSLPGSTPNVWQPHTPSANAITQSSRQPSVCASRQLTQSR